MMHFGPATYDTNQTALYYWAASLGLNAQRKLHETGVHASDGRATQSIRISLKKENKIENRSGNKATRYERTKPNGRNGPEESLVLLLLCIDY